MDFRAFEEFKSLFLISVILFLVPVVEVLFFGFLHTGVLFFESGAAISPFVLHILSVLEVSVGSGWSQCFLFLASELGSSAGFICYKKCKTND